MTDFNALKSIVKKKGFGSTLYGNINGEPVYLSRGIREVFMNEDGLEQSVLDSVREFQKGNYGDAVENGKTEREGHEYGRYDICSLTSDGADTAVWIHRAEQTLLVYFKFER